MKKKLHKVIRTVQINLKMKIISKKMSFQKKKMKKLILHHHQKEHNKNLMKTIWPKEDIHQMTKVKFRNKTISNKPKTL